MAVPSCTTEYAQELSNSALKLNAGWARCGTESFLRAVRMKKPVLVSTSPRHSQDTCALAPYPVFSETESDKLCAYSRAMVLSCSGAMAIRAVA